MKQIPPQRFLRIILVAVFACSLNRLGTAQNANQPPGAVEGKEAPIAAGAQSPQPKNAKPTLAELKTTALKGDVEAQFTLGALYYVGKEVPRDLTEAAQWFRKAADQGHAESQWWIGRNYETGETEPDGAKDFSQAAAWYRKAAEQGDAKAQFSLGTLYDGGQGVPQSFSEALKWLQKAADQGHADAERSLGVFYEEGKSVTHDFAEAYKWYNLAAARGDATAALLRRLVMKKMLGKEIAEGQRRSLVEGTRSSPAAGPEAPGLAEPILAPKGTGAGFFITGDGYLLTSFSLVENANQIRVETAQGTFPARLVRSARLTDLALLKVAGVFIPLPLTTNHLFKSGDSVIAASLPRTGTDGPNPLFYRGSIGLPCGPGGDPRHFQVSLPPRPEHAGAALVNRFGNVAGIMAGPALAAPVSTNPPPVNYAIKSGYALAFVQPLPEVTEKLKAPYPPLEREVLAVAREAREAAALVLVY